MIQMIAITGAAGFIGSNLAHRLSKMGHRLLLVDHPLTAAKAANWIGLRQFEFLSHDQFADRLAHNGWEIELVFHLGACSRTNEPDWDYLLANNVKYSQELWAWCAANQRPFYYASSAATYGDGSAGFSDRIHPGRLKPLNLYGKSKNDFDLWVTEQIERGNPTPPGWAGLKFFNVYGPREAHKRDMASVVRQAHRQILERGEVSLFKSLDSSQPDGGQLRDFVHVEDCIEHMLWLWQHPRVSGLFNSGTGTARTFNDLVSAVFAAMGREPRVHYVDMPRDIEPHYQKFTQADMSTLRGAGYDQAPTSLEEGISQTLAAYSPYESETGR